MKFLLRSLTLTTKKETVAIPFSHVTFIHGPIGKGKSSVARLIDYCLGGEIERTPALQSEFISVTLFARIGPYECSLERGAEDTQYVRVTWSDGGDGGNEDSVNAPLQARDEPILDSETEVFNLSDLLFYLAAITPIKVRKAYRDPESPLIRLSFRDIWWYCYLDQTHLDSSFFHLDDPFRGRKSQDAMRFFTGLHSERYSQLEAALMKTIDEQKVKREAVKQIRKFMERFEIESESTIDEQIQIASASLAVARAKKAELEEARKADIHPSDKLRTILRSLGNEINRIDNAIEEADEALNEQTALRAELITAKTKAMRSETAGKVLEGVRFERCPECGEEIIEGRHVEGACRLCGTSATQGPSTPSEIEALRRDINERIEQLEDSISRRRGEIARMSRQRINLVEKKAAQDAQLQDDLRQYDSAFIESVRETDREIATLVERISALSRLQRMPQAIDDLEREAGALQGEIDVLRDRLADERDRLSRADENIAEIATEFRRILLSVNFPDLSAVDEVSLDPRNWKPRVVHGDQVWGFWDTGSGGKKTLFNVCYALAVHSAAIKRGMPVPEVLIIDSPTKNISDDENPELVRSLYDEIYELAREYRESLQLLIIDSDLVEPQVIVPDFTEMRMAGEPGAPSLIPYYQGP